MAGVSEVGRKTYEDFLDEMRDQGYDVEWLRKLLKKYIEDSHAEVDVEVLKTMVYDFTCNYDLIVLETGTGEYDLDKEWDVTRFYADYWWALKFAEEEMEAHDYKIKVEDALRLGMYSFYADSVYILGTFMDWYLQEVLGKDWDIRS